MLKTALDFLKGIQTYITISLAVSTLICGVGWHLTSLKLENARQTIELNKKTYEAAQKEAEAKALTNKINMEKKYEDEREKADSNYADLNSKYRAAVLRYSEAKRQASRPNLSGPSEASEVSNRSNKDSLVPVPEADLLICAENTARLENARDWIFSIPKQ